MIAAGDAAVINSMLQNRLEEVRSANWRLLYRDRETGEFWEMTWPQGEMHGGGPRRLTKLPIVSPDEWADPS
jgi:hypothetical protein